MCDYKCFIEWVFYEVFVESDFTISAVFRPLAISKHEMIHMHIDAYRVTVAT